VTNWKGLVHERLEYTPYGELWIDWKNADAPEDSTPFRFTGKERDSETGLYYYGARYLDPKTSRWLSGDPALGEYLPVAPVSDDAKKHNQSLPGMGGVFNTVNMHAYHYAGNNPVKYVDPDGEASEAEVRARENETKILLREMISSPEDFTVTSYVRKAFAAYFGKYTKQLKPVVHSFYIIKNKIGVEYTLSFNGAKIAPFSRGYWWKNSDSDQESILNEASRKKWDVKRTRAESEINVQETAKNILTMIEDTDQEYFAADSVIDLNNNNNCNTALEKTRSFNPTPPVE
jgi:RHS repeat-associated protein